MALGILLPGLLLAYNVGQTVNVTGDYIYNEAEGQEAPEELSFGAQASTDMTLDNLTYGSSRSNRLTFAQGATSTPGTSGLFAITNYGLPKICDKLEVDVSTAVTTGGLLGTGFFIWRRRKRRRAWETSLGASVAPEGIPRRLLRGRAQVVPWLRCGRS